ncbi:MAG: uroporphyrinogen decarboxylase [Candidatus Tokpelaia sp.]|uniref:uroporphyrinogen decarboxylase n=1 Tax=Candidatus Tokpelaia sp. TaxID=2233777 RepID=UPI00123BBA6E|nr:uroporphyrinogen decarboxylase [Candidatus Tokpelaia sp.]KAA6206001.1 MAG: uroporphyrinogen decarboxylase [Candidatus Tokpelaia sp.]KAA6406091.1 uroporphyrinogen decarboxylase [Candidatus Tokpelaia sp.]
MMKKLLNVLNGEKVFPPPVWLMRQAGRYLPEYREIRKQAGSFLHLCQNPALAAEVTLQPIRRFGFDAAILFSDILVVPHALGRDLRFEEGRGPIMTPLQQSDIARLNRDNALSVLSPAFETIKKVKAQLSDNTAIIGFCGAPWTVATYMIAGQATPDQAPARLFAYHYKQDFAALMRCLADVSAEYLIGQIKAGADCVQIFDSWAGVLDEQSFAAACIAPVRYMVQKIRAACPKVPIIAFPRGAGLFYRTYAEKTGVTALGLDWTMPLSFAAKLQEKLPVQGNLDPLRLMAGGEVLSQGVEAILSALQYRPFIFNLGHGIMPQTPISHVDAMLNQLRALR